MSRRFGIVLVALLWSAAESSAQCPPGLAQQLVASDAAWRDQFGTMVAASGTLALVGASHNDGPPPGPITDWGSVYAFARVQGQWVQEQIIWASDGDCQDRVGEVIAMEGSLAVVGAPRKNNACSGPTEGAVYVLRRVAGTWTEEQRLVPSSATTIFGISLAVSGNFIAVGENNRAFLFEYDGNSWIERHVLSFPSVLGGVSVALDGDRLLAGGAAFVTVQSYRFTSQTLVPEQALVSGVGLGGAPAFRMALQGDVAVIGAPADPTVGGLGGAAYVFRHDGAAWGPAQQLIAADGVPLDALGLRVALDRNRIAVTKRDHVVIFEFDGVTWKEAQTRGPFANAFPSIDLNRGGVFVGDSLDSSVLDRAGSVSIYPLEPPGLTGSSTRPAVGDVISFTTCNGLPGSPAVFLVTAINGHSTDLLLHGIGLLDASGSRVMTSVVPSTARGLNATFVSLSLDARGRLVRSQPETIVVQ